MGEANIDLSPDEIAFDEYGRVIVSNPEFISVLEGLADGALLASTSNSGGCGDAGCGNTGNAGGCGTANASCASMADIHFDDWNIVDHKAIIENALFAQGMIDVKFGGKPLVPIKLED